MKTPPIFKMVLSALILLSLTVHAKDFRNQDVGDYSHSSFDMTVERANTTFLHQMKETIFPLISNQAPFQTPWTERRQRPRKDAYMIDIRQGIGAEVKLADNVTTYHVGYANSSDDEAHKSGRSFGVYDRRPIADGSNVDYIADASYKFYLDELEEVLEDSSQARMFYQAIFKFLISSDASGFNKENMESHTKRVAADFVAVYIAEQYRRLVHSNGRNLDRREWDNAHLQTTILANFHAGQSEGGMFFGGQYTNRPFRQKDSKSSNPEDHRCAYQILKTRTKSDDQRWLPNLSRRSFRLSDYWQFGSTCGGPSGVNVTRRDFEKLGSEVTEWMNSNGQTQILDQIWNTSENTIGTRRNVVAAVADGLIDDDTPNSFDDADELVEALVDF
ncbi:MAG: hypothetical protein AAF203_06410, partial [Pseudomonadota bacterium]